MKQLGVALGLVLVLLLGGCGGPGGSGEVYDDSYIEGETEISEFADLEKYGGSYIYVTGVFGVHPKHRGKHAMVTLDAGLVIYIPHVDQWWKGEDWYVFDGQRVTVGGMLHSYVESPIDGMVGPYFDDPAYPTPAGVPETESN